MQILYRSLLPLITLFFLACNATPDIALSPKLDQYADTEENCQDIRLTPELVVPEALKRECNLFLKRLDKANLATYESKKLKKAYSAKSPKYIHSNTEANRQYRKTEIAHQKLTKLLNRLSLEAIENDDLSTVALTLRFKETQFTKKHYDYYKRQSASYQESERYRAFEKKYASSLVYKGMRYLSNGDKKRALKLFKSAAALENTEAYYLAGIIYEAKNVDKAITWHSEAKERGIDASGINLARLYLRKHNPKKAQAFYIEAAENENAFAQFILYTQYQKTANTKASRQALPWLKRSAENGFAPAFYAYGKHLLKAKKSREAIPWLLKATQHGITAANAELGILYYQQKSYTQALNFLTEASTPQAKYLLARMYEKGLGVKTDYYHAYLLYKEASKLGNKRAKKALLRLKDLKTEKEKAHYDAALRKKREAQKRFEADNGRKPILRNLRNRGTMIYINGIVSMPLKGAYGFIVTNEEGTPYYIIDKERKTNLTEYQYVELSALATGHTITISDDHGSTVDLYQLIYTKTVTKEY